MKFSTVFLIIIFFSILVSLKAQQIISLDDIYKKNTFKEQTVRNVNWTNDDKYYTYLKGNDIVKVDITNGKLVEIIIDHTKLKDTLLIEGYSFAQDESKLLIFTDRESIYRRSYKAYYYIYDIQTSDLISVDSLSKISNVTFSPDASKISYTKDNNLFYLDIETMEYTAITKDGNLNNLIHGSTDWVYEEELYMVRAYCWSPDSRKIAFLTFDESDVKEYTMQLWNIDISYPVNRTFKYPKAGENNSLVSLSVYDIDNRSMQPIDIGNKSDSYIVSLDWTRNHNIFYIKTLNRLQNRMDLLHIDPENGEVSSILIENSDTYVDVTYNNTIYYLDHNKGLITTSEKDGFKHIYWYDMEGNLKKQITSGKWECTKLIGVDESFSTPSIYYISTERSHMERDLYSIDLNGEHKKRFTTRRGIHNISIGPNYRYYLDYYSSCAIPLQVTLRDVKKPKYSKVMEDNKDIQQNVDNYSFSSKEFFTFRAMDSSLLYGYMLKPSSFDSTKKYPLLIYQYSGPRSQLISNSWGGSHYYWHQHLTQRGYIIAYIDVRGTGYRGKKFSDITYRNLGKFETADIIAGSEYLGNLGYVDKSRMGIWGWSYGGYMASLLMTLGSPTFKLGIAIAPVTHWKLYDTIYTERYLQRPKDNEDGYENYSPLNHASKLEGDFLLVHGTGDDNVHFQNSILFQNSLIKSSKQFESFYYPNKAHSLGGSNTRLHLFTYMTRFIEENL